MGLRLPEFSRFFSKLFYDILPAALASVIGAYVFGHAGSKPAEPPRAEVAAPASAELMKAASGEAGKTRPETKPQPARAKAEEHPAAPVREAEARPDVKIESKPEPKPDSKLETKPFSITVRNSEKTERAEREKAEHERIERERAERVERERERRSTARSAPAVTAKSTPAEAPQPREAAAGAMLPPPSQPHPLGSLVVQPSGAAQAVPVQQAAPPMQPATAAPVQQATAYPPPQPAGNPTVLGPLPVQTITEAPRTVQPSTEARAASPIQAQGRGSNRDDSGDDPGVLGRMRDAAESVTSIFKGGTPPRPPGDLTSAGGRDPAM